MFSSTVTQHHRSTTKTIHKPFKSRHSTKGSIKARNKGKMDEPPGTRKTPHQQVMSKLGRRNKARQLQSSKRKELQHSMEIFDGRRGAPRIIVVVPLCEDGDAAAAVLCLNRSLEIDGKVPKQGTVTFPVDRFKQKAQYVMAQRSDFLGTLDACKVADFVIFVLSALQEVDEYGESLLRSIESQGISNVIIMVQNHDAVEPAKRRSDVKKSLLSYITHFFPTETRIYSLDSLQECSSVMRSLCTQHPTGVRWRNARSYMLAEEVRWDNPSGLVIGGTIRGRGLKADRLVHLPGWGDYQIEKICSWETGDEPHGDAMAIDNGSSEPKIIETSSINQDDLAELAPEEEVMKDTGALEKPVVEPKGVLLDDQYYYEERPREEYPIQRKVPEGTSSYQATWIVDSDSEFGDDGEDQGDVSMRDDTEDEDQPCPEDGEEGFALDSKTTYEPTEFDDGTKSEMFLDPSPLNEAQQIEAFRNRQKEHQEDTEFPDEIELHPTVLTRERLLRYRGLRSLRTSKWSAEPDKPHQPPCWDRLTKIENYKATQNKAYSEALTGGVPPGTRVLIYLRNASPDILKSFLNNPARQITLYSLLRHERKKSVLNFSVIPNSDYEGPPVKSKDTLLLQVGPRRLLVKPLFSQSGVTQNNVHKFERFLHQSRVSVATVIGPITFGNIPVLLFRLGENGNEHQSFSPSPSLIATGTFLNTDIDRIIAKRIILTGHPFKIHKKLVTVRYMFFNAEDVNWFKPVQLYTKRGRSGFMKESLGTHGYFKATFDGKINPQDAVAMSLYKRVWPRESREFRDV